MPTVGKLAELVMFTLDSTSHVSQHVWILRQYIAYSPNLAALSYCNLQRQILSLRACSGHCLSVTLFASTSN